ncbi:MAG: hypothetical protein ACI4TX_03360 [Christensenellales bacterium]
MKLISIKKEHEVKRLIKDYDLNVKPYELKEYFISLIGFVLPLTTYCVFSNFVDSLAVVNFVLYSAIPSIWIMQYGEDNAKEKYSIKQRIANNYYANKDCAKFNVSDLRECDRNRADAVELAEKLTKLKALKIRRDARDITYCEYIKSIKEL